jgi:hypothetical protein
MNIVQMSGRSCSRALSRCDRLPTWVPLLVRRQPAATSPTARDRRHLAPTAIVARAAPAAVVAVVVAAAIAKVRRAMVRLSNSRLKPRLAPAMVSAARAVTATAANQHTPVTMARS